MGEKRSFEREGRDTRTGERTGMCKLGEYTAFTFISIEVLKKLQNARGAVGFQGAYGAMRPLVAASNLAKTSNEVIF